MAEMFSYAFMRHALLAAVLTGALCSAVAFFVVLKRLSFLGVGISHTALAGIALGLVTGLDPFWCGSAFAVATALATGHISRRGQLYEDTVIGIFFAAGMALGVAMLSSLKGYYPEIFSPSSGTSFPFHPPTCACWPRWRHRCCSSSPSSSKSCWPYPSMKRPPWPAAFRSSPFTTACWRPWRSR